MKAAFAASAASVLVTAPAVSNVGDRADYQSDSLSRLFRGTEHRVVAGGARTSSLSISRSIGEKAR